MIEKIFSVLPSVAMCLSSAFFLITSFISYLSCDSCNAKRLQKLEKLRQKIQEQINKQNK